MEMVGELNPVRPGFPRVPLVPQIVTADEFMRLPETTWPIELIDGVVIHREPSLMRHALMISELMFPLMQSNKLIGDGEWFPRLDLLITQYNVFQPDLLYFDAERMPAMDSIPVTVLPEIVVEVTSAESWHCDQTRKRAAYADRGVPEYWIVDPHSLYVTINMLDDRKIYTGVTLHDNIIPIGRFAGTVLDFDKFITGDPNE